MSEKYSITRDLKEAEAMVKALSTYVHQDALYGTVGGGMFSSGMPALTVGALLLRLRRLSALQEHLSESDRERLQQIMMQHDQIRDEWRVHYQNKVVHEAKSRLDAMKRFFEECADDPRLCASAYQPEASRRTIVQEILAAFDELQLEQDDELTRKLNISDGGLRRYTQPGDFVWDSTLEAVYPRQDFWWLYQHPSQPEK